MDITNSELELDNSVAGWREFINEISISRDFIRFMDEKFEEESRYEKIVIDNITDISTNEKNELKKKVDEKLKVQKNGIRTFNKGKVIIKYLDVDTNENVAPLEEIYDLLGNNYQTNSKSMNYYHLVSQPVITSGKIEIGTKVLEYKYNKKIFDLELMT